MSTTGSSAQNGLFEAARNGDSATVQEILKDENINPNTFTGNQTALHVAVIGGHLDVVKELLAHPKINTNVINNLERTPLSLAISSRKKQIALNLINDLKTKINMPNGQRQTPLHLAALTDDEDIIMALLERSDELNFNPQDNQGMTPLLVAIMQGNENAAIALLKHSKTNLLAVDKFGRTALHIAAISGNTSILKELLSKDNVDPNALDASKKTPLHFATEAGDRDIVLALLNDERVAFNTIDDNESSPLKVAIESGNVEVVIAMLEHPRWQTTHPDDNLPIMIELFQDLISSASKTDHEQCALLLAAYAKHYPLENMHLFLSSHTPLVLVIESLLKNETLLASEKNELATNILRTSIRTGNALMIQMLVRLSGFDAMIDLSELSPTEEIKLKRLKEWEDPATLSERMIEFYQGELGEITYEGGLITVAQVAKRKSKPNRNLDSLDWNEQIDDSYRFDPTVLKNEEFEGYLNLLKQAAPVRERFVLVGSHWLCGEITIDLTGKVNVLLIDSLGVNTLPTEGTHYFIAKPCEVISQSFPSDKYQVDIFVDNVQRQHSKRGCFAFALDDVAHLYVAERYLPEVDGIKPNLFEYLASTTHRDFLIPIDDDNDEKHYFNVHLCGLPLSLMRTMQSMQFASDRVVEGIIKPSVLSMRKPEEQLASVNKRGQTAERSFRMNLHPEAGRLRNKRLNEKLEKMGKYNYDYLATTSEEEIQHDMERYSLRGLPERLVTKKSSAEHDLLSSELRKPSLSFLGKGELVSPTRTRLEKPTEKGTHRRKKSI